LISLESGTVIALPILAAALAACTPSQDDAMRSPSPTAAQGAKATAAGPVRTASADEQHAAPGPIPQPVSAAENPAPAVATDSAAEAVGRRTLSTAFVRVSPDGHLTVERRDGRTLVLRNVVMRRTDYCGTRLSGGKPGAKYCGGYGEVAAARPGGGEPPAGPDLAAPNPLAPRTPAKRD
jgi:hypothetical protein